MKQKVIILGGGVAGLSAAHELIERNFDVDVYEAKGAVGGKAKSVDVRQDDGTLLPGEHGFRFFPGFYRHLIHTLMRIPHNNKTVFDFLTSCPQGMIARNNEDPIKFVTHFPESFEEVKRFFGLKKEIGKYFEPGEGPFFIKKIIELLTSCTKRKNEELEKITWWDFVDAENHRSKDYKTLLATGLTRTLVAADAKKVSAKTGGNVVMQFVCDLLKPRCKTDRVLMGPTSEIWINPWKKYLKDKGVKFFCEHEVEKIHLKHNKITSVDFRYGSENCEDKPHLDIHYKNKKHLTDHDAFYILALPVEDAEIVLSDEIKKAEPKLASLNSLTKCVRWMTGVQIYLNTDAVHISEGHVIYTDSEWALTSISQIQFWNKNGYRIDKNGNTKVKDIISVDISDWFSKSNGALKKEAKDVDKREDIAKEVMRQINNSLIKAVPPVTLTYPDGNVETYYLDRSIIHPQPGSHRKPASAIKEKHAHQRTKAEEFKTINEEPLLVNESDTWRLRPDAVTKIPNLFLAADYVRTNTDLATMEAANEAARRAVNGILEITKSNEPKCRIWNMYQPFLLFPYRWMDHIRYSSGKKYSMRATFALAIILFPLIFFWALWIVIYFFCNMFYKKSIKLFSI